MKAAIFAAGEGRRMRPLTFARPKPLVEILGKPIIQYVWDALPDEIDEVVVAVGYKQEMIQQFLGDEYRGKRITYVEQVEPLGTAHALMRCRPHLEHEERFLLMYADDIHGKDAVTRCLSHNAALLACAVDDPRRFGVVVRNENGTIGDIEEKPEHPKTNLAATGVYVLTSDIFTYGVSRSENGEHYLTDMIKKYASHHPMYVVESDLWIPIAYPEDITRTEELLKNLPRL